MKNNLQSVSMDWKSKTVTRKFPFFLVPGSKMNSPINLIADTRVRRSCPITNAMLNNTNVRIVREDLFKHLKGTPLENLVNQIHLSGTTLSIQHKSDIIRVALLWRRGGIYLDHDTVVLRPLTGLHNTIGMSNGNLSILINFF